MSAAAPGSRFRGYALGLAGVLVLSTDALLVRLVDASVFVVVTWRGALMCLVFLALEASGFGLRGSGRRRPAGPDLLAALLYACSTFAFITAIVRLPVAQALMLVATVPLTSALLGRLFAGDPLTTATMLASLACTGGIALALTPAGLPADPLGIAAGLVVSVTFAGYLTILRRGEIGRPNLVLATASLGSAIVAAPLADGLVLEGGRLLAALALGLVVMPLAQGLLSAAPRHLTTSEVGMLLTLETVFGSLLAWAFLGEAIDGRVAVGGLVVVTALTVRAFLVRPR